MNPRKIHLENIDSNNFKLFIRDLSLKIDIDIKKLVKNAIIEDAIIENNKGSKKIKKPKKKDIIIENQNKKRYEQNIKTDFKKIECFLDSIDINNINDIHNNLFNLKTKEGKIELKCKILEKLWNSEKKNLKVILSLYFEVVKEKRYIVNYEYMIRGIEKKIINKDYDFKLYMLKELGDMLPPLNYWDNENKKLEDWQITALKYIKNNNSVIIKAPTSSGKSLIGLSAGIFYNKIIYICPSIPVVYQIGSHFTKFGKNVQYILNGYEETLDKNGNIYIGTPKLIEDYIYKTGIDFDYAVFDEIHNLNNENGDIYENLIKLINCNFTALSASIENIEYLEKYFNDIHNNKNIKLVVYNDRFINNQKWLWNNKSLVKLNPISCLDKENIDKILGNISFTPNDCAIIWESLDDIIEDYDNEILDDLIADISPNIFFSDLSDETLITLNDSKRYEKKLKESIVEINKIDNSVIDKLIDKYRIEYKEIDNNNEIIKMLKDLKKKKMLPMLLFNSDENVCENLFNYIYEELNKNELDDNPYYYEILEKKNDLYKEYLNNREVFVSNLKVKNNSNSKDILDEKKNNYDLSEKNKYINSITSLYNNLINKIKKGDSPNKEKQLKNIKRDLNNFIECPDFNSQDIFQKHHDYCFTYTPPMSSESIRKVRKEIYNSLGYKIPYESNIFQMLKRGIGIYTENMPREYKWIIQKLLSEKLIGIVITDRTLCQGIDLPIKTSCIYGFENNIFREDDIFQISGRAGRRGHDTSGNVIYYNVKNYKNYILNRNPSIIGSEVNLYNNYNILEKISNIKTDTVFNNIMNNKREIKDKSIIINNNYINWLLRYTNLINDEITIESLDSNIEITKDINDKEIYLLNIFNDEGLITVYKKNKVDNYDKKNIKKYRNIIDILIILYNNINKNSSLKNTLFRVFIKLKNILIKDVFII